MKNIFNILGFQAGWWACVLGTTYEAKYLGPLVMSIFILIHLYYFSNNTEEIKLIIIFAFIGTAVDTAISLSKIINYNGLYNTNILIAPLWITAMWCGFTATVNHSMAWLQNRWIESFILGAIFGPLAYLTGAKFGAIQLQETKIFVCIILALVWGCSVPAIYWANDRLCLK
ncbi:MAG: hypothetical protein CMG74_10940 [Candidatus Marinimicrobia bacterium]|nr:hypothetical protein [Candidatus Neomarinimicrobiota bacterium]|tara:strand:- start:1238 stop:1753 length:516 start_codon:yes stop_codon:yes gene_type:complete